MIKKGFIDAVNIDDLGRRWSAGKIEFREEEDYVDF